VPKGDYTIHHDPMFEASQTIDVQALIDEVTDHWYNQTLNQVGDVLVRLGVMQGEFHWHTHQDRRRSRTNTAPARRTHQRPS
jgi:hypothetical protein